MRWPADILDTGIVGLRDMKLNHSSTRSPYRGVIPQQSMESSACIDDLQDLLPDAQGETPECCEKSSRKARHDGRWVPKAVQQRYELAACKRTNERTKEASLGTLIYDNAVNCM